MIARYATDNDKEGQMSLIINNRGHRHGAVA
jgi:hypothetical protein